jgi:hypothetical protein
MRMIPAELQRHQGRTSSLLAEHHLPRVGADAGLPPAPGG